MGGYCCHQSVEDVDAELMQDQDDKLDVEELLQEAGGELGSIELSLSCVRLPDKDKFSKSDPFVICFSYMEGNEEDKTLIGRTETVFNNLEPSFITPIMCSFEDMHNGKQLLFEVYHERVPERDYYDQVFMGDFRVSLQQIMTQKELVGDLVNNRTADAKALGIGLAIDKAAAMAAGTLHFASGAVDLVMNGAAQHKYTPQIHICAEHARNVQEKVIIEMRSSHVDRPRLRFGVKAAIANYFVRVSRVQGRRMMPVAQTNVNRKFFTKDQLSKGINPSWKPIHTKTFRLCNNDFHRPLLFQLFDYNFVDSSKPRLIGQGRATLAALTSGAVKSVPLINERLAGNEGYVNSGDLVFDKAQLLTSYSFLDYVKRGFEISCSMAIDFSSSNGARTSSKKSLHFIDPVDPIKNPNAYCRAIGTICKVVGRYATDQMFPCFGFGAVLDGKVHHSFPMSLDKNAVEIQGEMALKRAYVRCVESLVPCEPTCLAPVLRLSMERAKEKERHNPTKPSYQLLVIFTDGTIDDYTEAADVLVEASAAPMSVLIVGLGDGDREVSGDNGFRKVRDLARSDLRSVITGRSLRRGVANFVAWNDFKSSPTHDFARAALALVPKHFLSWVEMKGISLDSEHSETDLNFERDLNAEPSDVLETLAEVAKNDAVVGKLCEVRGLAQFQELNGEVGLVLGEQDGNFVIELPVGRRAMKRANLYPVASERGGSSPPSMDGKHSPKLHEPPPQPPPAQTDDSDMTPLDDSFAELPEAAATVAPDPVTVSPVRRKSRSDSPAPQPPAPPRFSGGRSASPSLSAEPPLETGPAVNPFGPATFKTARDAPRGPGLVVRGPGTAARRGSGFSEHGRITSPLLFPGRGVPLQHRNSRGAGGVSPPRVRRSPGLHAGHGAGDFEQPAHLDLPGTDARNSRPSKGGDQPFDPGTVQPFFHGEEVVATGLVGPDGDFLNGCRGAVVALTDETVLVDFAVAKGEYIGQRSLHVSNVAAAAISLAARPASEPALHPPFPQHLHDAGSDTFDV
ncbi:Protein BONZAI 3 [Diplonema papillatum]|nr:Protein BONZAI 3 [Diplonema papillatum]